MTPQNNNRQAPTDPAGSSPHPRAARYLWPVLFLLTLGFTLATALHLRLSEWAGSRLRSQNLLALLLGDSRKMLANHFFVKADVYFHRGYYPSIFEKPKEASGAHLAGEHHEEEAGGHEEEAPGQHEGEETDFLGAPRNWIEKFGRNFFVSNHSHLEHTDDVREILPWLQISAELDPHRIETFTMAAFWLRARSRAAEAERFLREGWRQNPDSYKILFELGRIYYGNYHNTPRARNLFELALRKWDEDRARAPEPDIFAGEEILAQLALLEEKEKRFDESIAYFKRLKEISPHPERIQQQLEIVEKEKGAAGGAGEQIK